MLDTKSQVLMEDARGPHQGSRCSEVEQHRKWMSLSAAPKRGPASLSTLPSMLTKSDWSPTCPAAGPRTVSTVAGLGNPDFVLPSARACDFRVRLDGICGHAASSIRSNPPTAALHLPFQKRLALKDMLHRFQHSWIRGVAQL